MFLQLINGIRSLSTIPHPSESFLNGNSVIYMEELYRKWKDNNASY